MSNKKRIAIFSITYDPFIGGAEVAIKQITDRLSDFEFELFTARLDSKLPEKEKVGNITVYRVGTGHKFLDKLLYPWRASKLALKMHEQSPYDIIHAVMATYAGLAAIKFKDIQSQVPYLLTLQSGDSDEFINKRTWFWKKRYKQIYTKADKIVAISNWLSERATKYGYKKEIEIIPNGVDIEKFNKEVSAQERTSIRNSWGAEENDFVIITSSRLVHKNGIDMLIGAMEYLQDNIILVIAGEGKDENKLRSLAKKFKDRVLFLGHVNHGELPRLLKSADVFARPSRSEGMGNSFVEAMATGIPVVARPVGGIVDFNKEEEVVLFAENEDSKSVANIIKDLNEDEVLIREISKKGKELSQKYNWKDIAEQYKQTYVNL